jgi:hypothetical protein
MARENKKEEEAPLVHKPSYFNWRTIRTAGTGLSIALVLVLGIALLLFVYFVTAGAPEGTLLPPWREIERTTPLRPRVEFLAEQLREQQTVEQLRLESSGWIDQEAGIRHIPIKEAMEIVIEQGLPENRHGDPEEVGPDSQ